MTTKELTVLNDRLTRVEDKIDKLSDDVATQIATCRVVRDILSSTHTAVYGDGDSLLTRTASLEQSRQSFRRGLRALWGLVLAVIGGGFVVWILEQVKHALQ